MLHLRWDQGEVYRYLLQLNQLVISQNNILKLNCALSVYPMGVPSLILRATPRVFLRLSLSLNPHLESHSNKNRSLYISTFQQLLYILCAFWRSIPALYLLLSRNQEQNMPIFGDLIGETVDTFSHQNLYSYQYRSI